VNTHKSHETWKANTDVTIYTILGGCNMYWATFAVIHNSWK